MLVENAMRLRKVTKVVAQNIVAAGPVCKQLGVATRSKDRIGQAVPYSRLVTDNTEI
jgi:hypothetical protein